MGRSFFFFGCVVVVLHFVGLSSAEVMTPVLGFLAAKQTVLLVAGLLGSLALIFVSAVFGGMGFFNILYLLAKAVYELARLLLCGLTVASLVGWFDLGVNLWLKGGGTLAIVLYAWLYGAALSLRLFDFNYPIKNGLLAYSTLPFVCLAMFWLHELIR